MKSETKHKFNLHTPLTSDLAEFIGAYIGDGVGFRYKHTGEIGLVGNMNLDRKYLCNYIPKKIQTFTQKCSIRYYYKSKENAMQLKVYSIEFYNLMTERFRFPKGKKSLTVQIPPEIFYAEEYIVAKCLRGIFDTDGGVFFDRRKIYTKPYIRIAAQLSSPVLINQIYDCLIRLGICATISKNKNIQINGEKNCKEFIRKIGFSNERHLSKIRYLE